MKAVFAEIVAFRTHTNSRIKYGFRALFLSKRELTLKKFVDKTVKIQMPIFTILANSNKVYEKSLNETNLAPSFYPPDHAWPLLFMNEDYLKVDVR
jgi:hypothetical protein